MKWKTKEGQEMEVSNMETSHIRNALAMLESKGFVGLSDLEFYLTCSPPNGEMASDCFYNELDEVLDKPVSKFIDIFKEELSKR